MNTGISKSRFTSYLKCPRLGYFACYPKRFESLKDPDDWGTKQRLSVGIRAGRLAREAFTPGVLIEHDQDVPSAIAQTEAALADLIAQYLFEATFACEALLARADVLRKVSPGVVDLIEVKAANDVKPEHIPDVAFQLHVLRKAGLEVRSCALMHFNPEYLYPGEGYDPWGLLKIDEITGKAKEWARDELPRSLEKMQRDISAVDPPHVRIKNGCKGGCPYYRQVCSLDAPARPVCELGGNHPKLFRALEDAQIETLSEVPLDFPGLVPEHLLVLQAIAAEGLALDRDALGDLAREAEFPLWFVDFETYSTGFPIFPGTRPWQQTPFQWSLHVLDHLGAEPRHLEFLTPDATDPRRGFAESLLEAIGQTGSVVVYSRTMESTRLKELARDFPDLAPGLLDINSRILDLLDYVRAGCYHPEMAGSRSLKKVTPVLAPHLDYGALDVHAGMEAMAAYEKLIDVETGRAEREALRAGLRAYCGVDTLAMVEIFKRLMDAAPAS